MAGTTERWREEAARSGASLAFMDGRWAGLCSHKNLKPRNLHTCKFSQLKYPLPLRPPCSLSFFPLPFHSFTTTQVWYHIRYTPVNTLFDSVANTWVLPISSQFRFHELSSRYYANFLSTPQFLPPKITPTSNNAFFHLPRPRGLCCISPLYHHLTTHLSDL